MQQAPNQPAPPEPIDARLTAAQRVVALLLLLAVAAASYLAAIKFLDNLSAHAGPPPTQPVWRVVTQQDVLGIPTGPLHPLNAEPLGLPPYPGARALSRFAVPSSDGTIEEVSAWAITPEHARPALSHYLQAATDRGFEPLRTLRDTDNVIVLTAKNDPTTILTVNLKPNPSGEIHLVVLLRYAMPARPGAAHLSTPSVPAETPAP